MVNLTTSVLSADVGGPLSWGVGLLSDLLFQVSCGLRSRPNTVTARHTRLAHIWERLKAWAINTGPDVGSQLERAFED